MTAKCLGCEKLCRIRNLRHMRSILVCRHRQKTNQNIAVSAETRVSLANICPERATLPVIEFVDQTVNTVWLPQVGKCQD